MQNIVHEIVFAYLCTMKTLKFLPFLLIFAALSSCSGGDSPEVSYDYVAVQARPDGPWSMLSADGSLKYADKFVNEPTSVCNGYFSTPDSAGYTLRKAGRKPEVVCAGLVSVGYMCSGLIPATFPGERIALLKGNGKVRFTLEPFEGKEIVACAPGYSGGLLIVSDEADRVGAVDTDGRWVVEPQYGSLVPFGGGYSLATLGDECFVVDSTGTRVAALAEPVLADGPFEGGRLAGRTLGGARVSVDVKGRITPVAPKAESRLALPGFGALDAGKFARVNLALSPGMVVSDYHADRNAAYEDPHEEVYEPQPQRRDTSEYFYCDTI